MTPAERCFVCGARDWRDERQAGGAFERVRCSHCGVIVDPERYDAANHAARLAKLLRPGPVNLAAGVLADVGATMDAFTLRIAASAVPLGVEPLSVGQATALIHPHGPPAWAHLVALPPAGSHALPPPFGLGGIARPDGAHTFAARLAALSPPSAPVVIVVDADSSDAGWIAGTLGSLRDRVRVACHPLAGEFGAQRCRVQDGLREAGARWALQLDEDETWERTEIDALRALTGAADRQGVVSIGLRRSNLVDGRRSDLWPDVQYRLNRTCVPYVSRVHERPDAGGWRRTMIALRGTIEHHLDGERVRARSQIYESMGLGGGRAGDEAALMRPFTP